MVLRIVHSQIKAGLILFKTLFPGFTLILGNKGKNVFTQGFFVILTFSEKNSMILPSKNPHKYSPCPLLQKTPPIAIKLTCEALELAVHIILFPHPVKPNKLTLQTWVGRGLLHRQDTKHFTGSKCGLLTCPKPSSTSKMGQAQGESFCLTKRIRYECISHLQPHSAWKFPVNKVNFKAEAQQ